MSSGPFQNQQRSDLDGRYDAYMSLYNGLDRSIWNMPAFLIAAVTLIIGFTVDSLGGDSASASAFVWGVVLALAATLMFLGAYSLAMLRKHQHMVGDVIREMETTGYFHKREDTKNDFFPRAPIVFFCTFCVFGTLLLAGSIQIFRGDPWWYAALNIAEQALVNDKGS